MRRKFAELHYKIKMSMRTDTVPIRASLPAEGNSLYLHTISGEQYSYQNYQ